MRTDAETGRFRLMVARAQNHREYSSVRPLSFSTGTSNDVDPAIDYRHRFLIFSSDRLTPGKGNLPGSEHLFIAFAPDAAHSIVCPIHIPGWNDPAESQVEARLAPDENFLYFASRHPDHPPGETAAGSWDNGKSNIWFVPLKPTLWQTKDGLGGCNRAI
jgi:hypothetical protein